MAAARAAMAAAALLLGATARGDEVPLAGGLAEDDECAAGDEHCAVSALQLKASTQASADAPLAGAEKWRLGRAGESCTQVCQTAHLECHDAALHAVKDWQATFAAAGQAGANCRASWANDGRHGEGFFNTPLLCNAAVCGSDSQGTCAYDRNPRSTCAGMPAQGFSRLCPCGPRGGYPANVPGVATGGYPSNSGYPSQVHGVATPSNGGYPSQVHGVATPSNGGYHSNIPSVASGGFPSSGHSIGTMTAGPLQHSMPTAAPIGYGNSVHQAMTTKRPPSHKTCNKDTTGSCKLMGCAASRNAVCQKKKCMCRPGYCVSRGKCVKQ